MLSFRGYGWIAIPTDIYFYLLLFSPGSDDVIEYNTIK